MSIDVFQRASDLAITSRSFDSLTLPRVPLQTAEPIIEALGLEQPYLGLNDMIQGTIKLSDEIIELFESGRGGDIEKAIELVEKKEKIAGVLGVKKLDPKGVDLSARLSMHGEHKAIDLSSNISTSQQADKIIIDLLGEDYGGMLIEDWKKVAGINLAHINVLGSNCTALLIKSHGKSFQDQEAYCSEAGLKLADDVTATINFARLIKKVIDAELDTSKGVKSWKHGRQEEALKLLLPEEKELFRRFRTGYIRTENGALTTNFSSPLRVVPHYKSSNDISWIAATVA